MRWLMIILPVMLALTGCNTKEITFSGMICPPGHTEAMVNADFRECRAYDEQEAAKATYPDKLDKECLECLIERGYKVGQ